MTIRWAHQNVGNWLDDLNPEVTLMMFGTNDLSTVREITVRCPLAPLGRGQGEGAESASVISRTVLSSLDMAEYETKMRQVVQKCLDNGTIVILSTIPPKHGQAEKAATFADAVRRIAREMQLPLTDYHAEILQRRPDDWDGATDQFRQYQGYDVPTLIARDGVHPSNPQKYANDYSDEALHKNGFALRNYLTLMKYAEVIEKVLSQKSASKDAP